ncbi:MAG: hypothetical protein JNL70_25275 [Saprospiraceae bacterium]|nr:hypothetical protein [Saprospiraceae bacterium]
MGKHLVWIGAFLALAFAGDRLVGYLLKHITQTSQFRYSKLYHSTENADILFVGNSRGLNFYQPEAERLTGQKTMNLSYNGMPADLAKCLVMDYLDRHAPPKVMIVDVTMCDRYNEQLKASMNLYTPYSERLSNLIKQSVALHVIAPPAVDVDTTDEYAGRKVYYGGKLSQLYQHNSEIFQRVLYHRNKPDNDWIVDRVIGEAATKDTAFKSYQVRMFPTMVNHLKEMVDYAKSKGVEVKLVINPYYPQFAETIRDSFLTPLKSYVEAETGMTVSDFSTSLQNVDEIGDYQHANKKGSTRYMNILSENGIFSSLNTNSIGINSVSTQDLSLANVATDSFDNFTANSPSSKESVQTAPAQNSLVSETQTTSTPSLPNENVAPHDPFVKPVNYSSVKKSVKKIKRRYDDYGFAVDTVGLGR